MKNIERKFVLISVAFIFSSIIDFFGSFELIAMKAKGPNTYNGTVITKENLYTIAPKPPDYFEKLVLNNYKKKEEFKIIVEGKRVFSLENWDSSNTIRRFCFKVEKITSWFNRQSLQAANQDLSNACLDKIDPKRKLKETNQTASRMFGHLRVLESAEINELNYIWRPLSYLIDVTGGHSISDERCAFYENEIGPNFKKVRTLFKNTKSLKALLPNKNFKEILIICKDMGVGGGWDLSGGNIFINEKTGKICPVDTEHPNTIKPTQIFNCDWNKKNPKESRYLHAVVSGLNLLYGDFKDEGYRKEIRCFVEENKFLSGASNFKELTTMFCKK